MELIETQNIWYSKWCVMQSLQTNEQNKALRWKGNIAEIENIWYGCISCNFMTLYAARLLWFQYIDWFSFDVCLFLLQYYFMFIRLSVVFGFWAHLGLINEKHKLKITYRRKMQYMLTLGNIRRRFAQRRNCCFFLATNITRAYYFETPINYQRITFRCTNYCMALYSLPNLFSFMLLQCMQHGTTGILFVWYMMWLCCVWASYRVDWRLKMAPHFLIMHLIWIESNNNKHTHLHIALGMIQILFEFCS